MTAKGKGRVIRQMAVQRIDRDGDIILVLSQPLTSEEEQLVKQATRLANKQNDLWKFFQPSKPATPPVSSGNNDDDGGDGVSDSGNEEVDFSNLNL